MEYENMRVPELKSLTRDRGLRNYSRMRKAELVAFLTICFLAFLLSCVISQFAMGNKILPMATFYLFQEIIDFGFFFMGNCTCITLG